MSPPSLPNTFSLPRLRRWLSASIAIGAIGYTLWAVSRGLDQTWSQLSGFYWPYFGLIIALTLLNYSLRYLKWHYLLGRVNIQISHQDNLPIFVSGLAMVISPAKAGELLKPWLIRIKTGAPLTQSVPVLIAERVTDGLAVVGLAALGVSVYYSEGVHTIALTALAGVGGIGLLMSRTLCLGLLDAIRPLAPALIDRLKEAYSHFRLCLDPKALVYTLTLSFVAWWAECVGLYLVFKGLSVDASLGVSTFLYAFATVFGAPSPGGMGMADAALGEGALQLIPGISGPQAIAATLLIRVATLWFGVIIGALALNLIQLEADAPSTGD